ncbi:MAG: tRNA nucleotidyltransferase, partial [Chloroflexi bacterium]|nr:tRNA nucleotidyltransferase [Chloroflexota bacterium]
MSISDHPLTRPTRKLLHDALDPPARTLLRAAEAASTATGIDLWAVGGAVRDIATGQPVHDLDLAIRGDPAAFLRATRDALGSTEARVEVAARFGTASLLAGDRRLDLARLRTEHYVSPGALPVVRATKRIEADLERRDFTVNAMALGLGGPRRGEFVDPTDGLGDLASRT